MVPTASAAVLPAVQDILLTMVTGKVITEAMLRSFIRVFVMTDWGKPYTQHATRRGGAIGEEECTAEFIHNLLSAISAETFTATESLERYNDHDDVSGDWMPCLDTACQSKLFSDLRARLQRSHSRRAQPDPDCPLLSPVDIERQVFMLFTCPHLI